jgi:hypothetical protein
MSLLVVSPPLPDASTNSVDFRTMALNRELRDFNPQYYKFPKPVKWLSEPSEALLHTNLDDDYIKPWWDICAYRTKFSCDVLFDLRRYKNLLPNEACLLFQCAWASNDFCFALADQADHELLYHVCPREGLRLYPNVANMAAQRFAVA